MQAASVSLQRLVRTYEIRFRTRSSEHQLTKNSLTHFGLAKRPLRAPTSHPAVLSGKSIGHQLGQHLSSGFALNSVPCRVHP